MGTQDYNSSTRKGSRDTFEGGFHYVPLMVRQKIVPQENQLEGLPGWWIKQIVDLPFNVLLQIWIDLQLVASWSHSMCFFEAANLRPLSDRKERPHMTDPVDWKQIFQLYPNGLMVTDREFTIRYVNGAFARLVGMEAEELLGRKCHDAFPGTMCGTAECPLAKARNSKSPRIFNGRQHCKVEKHLPWVVTATALQRKLGTSFYNQIK